MRPPELCGRIIRPDALIARADTPRKRLETRLFYWNKGAHAGQVTKHLEDEEYDEASPSERLKLAALLLEAGYMTQAVNLGVDTYSAHPDLFRSERYAALSLAIDDYAPELTSSYQAELKALRAVFLAPSQFEDELERCRESVCVVGNAPVLLQATDGVFIDSHKLVIRFNNFGAHPRVRASTGNKLDVWARTFDYSWLWRRDDKKTPLMLCPLEAPFYRKCNVQDLVMDAQRLGQRLEFMPRYLYHDLRKDYELLAPSTGMLILYWIYDYLGGLEEVTIRGFSMAEQAGGMTVQYFDQGHVLPPSPHDWEAEAEILKRLQSE